MISSIFTTVRLAVFMGSLRSLLGHPSPAGNDLLSPEYGIGGIGGKKGLAGTEDLTQLTRMVELEAVGSGSPVDNSGVRECGKYMIVSVRGTSENQIRPVGYAKFISGVLAAVPGGGNYEVGYPATTDYATGPSIGATDMMRYITGRKARCPEEKYLLIGYSEGAMAVTQYMNLPGIPISQIVGIVLYGNPYFRGGAPQNSCSAKSGLGIASVTGIHMPPGYSSLVFDCCVTGDTICQTTGSMAPHLSYGGSQYEQQAIRFAEGKIERVIWSSGRQGGR